MGQLNREQIPAVESDLRDVIRRAIQKSRASGEDQEQMLIRIMVAIAKQLDGEIIYVASDDAEFLAERNAQIYALVVSGEMTTRQVAKEHGVSIRTIQKVVRDENTRRDAL